MEDCPGWSELSEANEEMNPPLSPVLSYKRFPEKYVFWRREEAWFSAMPVRRCDEDQNRRTLDD